MKSKIKFIAPILLAVFFVFALAYGINTKFDHLLSIFSPSITDTTDNPPPGNFKDVSQMFNERGLYKSNSYSFDESEVINDFNGNLMYEIPLYNYELPGELNLDIKMTYNSSVGHQVNFGQASGSNTTVTYYNMNFPEWIISLNGVAVQVFNFETEFYTRPEADNVVEQSAINPLIPGYHFDDRLISVNGTDRDRIKILAGDGSLITLVNKSWTTNSSEAEKYTGIYHSEEKESYMWAKVSFTDNDTVGTTNYPYKNRIVELMKGDGSVFVFREYRREFYDLRFNSVLSHPYRPQMLLLEKIIDRFGHGLYLDYEFVNAPSSMGLTLYGRPLLKSIINDITGLAGKRMDISLIYAGNMAKILNSSEINGNYLFRFYNAAYYTQGGLNNLAFINKIVNPLFQEAAFTPQAENKYVRILDEVPNPTAIGGSYQDIKFNSLLRLDSVRTFLKSKKVYSYYPSGVNNISIIFPQTTLNSTYHQGYGRDPFYSNMVSSKNDYDENTFPKSTSSFDYDFTDVNSNFSTLPVDDNDTYTTTKYILSNDENTINSTPDQLKTIREYKVYPSRYEVSGTETEVHNYNGVTKLIQEKEIDVSDNSVYLSNDYEYNTGTSGSFLMTEKTNTMKGISRTWQWTYEYFENNANNTDSVVSKKTETDPNNVITKNEFTRNFKNLSFYCGLGSHIVYKYNIPIKDYKYIGETKTYEKTYEYFTDTANDNKGFYGQLRTEKIHNSANFSQYIETKYEYYKLDTAGKHLYTGGLYPYKEGNLKLITQPDGQVQKYFYHPVTITEDKIPGQQEEIDAPPEPYVSYKIKYNNGNIAIKKAQLKDTRLPTRIDNYKISGSSIDTLKKQYFEYNAAGYPVKIINENNFLTELTYQPTHRISTITLPGDFSTEQSYDSLFYNDTYIDTILVIPSVGWGNIDLNNNALTVTKESPDVGQCAYFQLLSDVKFGYRKAAFVKFNFNNVFNLADIDSAMFYIAPYLYRCDINGNYISNTDFNVSLKSVYASTTPTLSSCTEYNNVENSTASINNYTITTDVNVENTINNCYFKPHNLNVKPILEDLRQNNRNLYGVFIEPQLGNVPVNDEDRVKFLMEFTECENFNAAFWSLYYAPKITVYGHYLDRDTLTIRVSKGTTYYYRYDDKNNTITTYSRLTHDPNTLKKIKYYIDGFGSIKQKNILVNNNDSNRFFYKYNYLLKLAEDIDARNNSTKYSNDFLGRETQTKHADDSISINSYGYTNSLGGYFGSTYNKFVEIRQYEDETHRQFVKYFDAIGNLLREIKYVSNNNEPDRPFDPDTTFQGQDNPGDAELITDYKYDNLYRLIEVKTPNNKHIYYSYDGYGRQIERSTPDAGYTKYSYDNNSNLVLSQDANQRALDTRLFTKRTYDGLNRLLTIGEIKPGNYTPPGETGPFGDTTVPFEFDSPQSADSIYIINVYDTLTSAVYDIFNSNKPSDFGNLNYTKGSLVATAYRTKLSDYWNYKFYRYNERGNVIKMWSYIDGLGWKSMTYQYNSQNQMTYFDYQPNNTDGKIFKYGYDDAGRLTESALYAGAWTPVPEEGDNPAVYYNLARYTYNQNSQIAAHGLNGNALVTEYEYNNRNWVKWTYQSPGPIFRYSLFYNGNGNIRYHALQGSYANNFSETDERRYLYIYDKSNRLLTADRFDNGNNQKGKVVNSYDADGNLLNLKRYNPDNSLSDNFSYTYYNYTNKLKNIGSGSDYTYDANGNVTNDNLNRNGTYKYDWRNLLTEIRSVKTEDGLFGPEDKTYYTKYRYDEAGNRIFKQVWKYTGPDPEPIFNGDSPYWQVQSTEYYVRDISGKEVAIYNGTTLEQWNLYGLDQIGHMNADTIKYFYLKDHLGSTRAVINTQNQVVSAQDYDCWGYLLENRTYQSNNTKYKYTGKERDNENNYDYFGARYYDNRIGRWGGEEPKLDKFISYSPYTFSICNPINIKDINGLDVDVIGYGASDVYDEIKSNSKLQLAKNLGEGGKIRLRKNANVDVNKLSDADKILYEAISNKEKTVIIKSLESPVFKRDNDIYTVLGGTAGTIEGNTVTHFVNLESASYLENAGVNTVGETIIHEIIEGYLRLGGLGQWEAHGKVVDKYIPQFGSPETYIGKNEDVITIGFSYQLFGPRQQQNVFSFDPKTLEIQEWFSKNSK